jgi:photosystem II stability/assembly factor-like uncharacterized protein
MKRLFLLIAVAFLSLAAFSVAKFPSIPLKPHHPDFHLSQSGNRADFTWDWEGPEAGIVWNVAIDPSNNNLAFATSDGGHLWRTVDGASWILVQDFRYSSPRHVLYTAPDTALAVRGDSLFYTPDGGNNWYPSSAPFSDIDGLSEQVSNTVYLSHYGGIQETRVIHHSDDCGFTWTLVDTIFDHAKFHCIRFDPSNDSTIYYGVTATGGFVDTTEILKSTDMGASWLRIFNANTVFPVRGITDIEVNPYNPDEIFVCFGYEGIGLGPILSINGGNSWDWLPGALISGLAIPFDVEFSDSDTVIVTNLFPPGMFKGVNFPAIGWQFFRVDSTVAFTNVEIGSGGTYYSGTMGDGVYKSTNDGFTWSPVNTNLRAHFVASFAGENVSECTGSTFYTKSGYSSTLYKTTNGGLTWQKYLCPYLILSNSIELCRGNPDIVYIGGFGGEFSFADTLFFDFFRSTDGGQSWTPMDTIPMPTSGPDNAYYSLWVSPTDPSRLLAVYVPADTTPLLIRSSNSGADWDTVFHNAHNIHIAGTDTVFAGADSTLYVSFNRGTSWQPLSYNLQIYEMSYNPENQLLYVIRATASGDSLSSINLSGTLTNIQEMSGGVHCMSTPGANGIYLSFWLGYLPLFVRSFDGGQTFDIDTLDFLPVELLATPSEILLADLGSSFRRSSDAIGISHDETTPIYPYSLKAAQSIFSTAIKFECTLPKSAPLAVSVWSIDGRLVKNVYQGICNQGTHVFWWNGRSDQGCIVPSGIYFVRMDAEGEHIPPLKIIKVK